ncbi:MAG: ATP-grasp domain-containing protein [Mesorhizobium sp.]|uniref:ATP-grasp domain-containing protein n=1 Tax=unclassified Mesorhizobium TaxID=325217 RepID=UPI000FD3DFE1|nr:MULTISPECIES: acetyl-CoA carboxylase biotin carboxylase subunit family protein [unclassified Mesorhizobium]RVD44687.1 ATP-grasp domain-containing protein [Mesorhizobium sp. M4A.F.Ca.ET.020.02.1.1]RWC12745.1 MAG: ATP-grasp domain-containing protein [Mesorhizobium sp.]RWC26144.1 MAG: ATP-grasp domain-containing protein [Mesorhizobium sp.]RWC52074.1 MAG: ATP-grasp domain-containing protein [Mesorhizobium sp.]RWD40701.1 MAG: ATP-grasp domain-containing protein [Mesorhizobium sp.]
MGRRALIMIEGHRRNGLLFVQAAKRLGLHPITLSVDPTQYDYLAADGIETIHVDTGNVDALICECTRLRATYDIAGITGFADFDESVNATVGKLCRHFNLPGPNPGSIEHCCDKFAQRKIIADAGVPIPAFRVAATTRGVQDAAAEIGLPVVLKPTAGNGSSGVRLCRNVDELAEHTTDLLRGKHIGSSSPEILVEEFAQGPHYSVEVMGNDVIAIGAAEFGPPPHFVCREYTYPAPLTHEENQRIVDLSLSCLRALDLGWGAMNIDLRWTKRGPVVIEVNPRLAGSPIPQLVQLAYGVDLITEHIKLVIAGEWNLRRRHSHNAAARILVSDRDGTLDWIGGGSQAAAVPGVVEVKLYVQPKTPIVRKGDYRDKIGHVIAASPSRARTQAALQRAVDLIRWSITSFPTIGKQELSGPSPRCCTSAGEPQ